MRVVIQVLLLVLSWAKVLGQVPAVPEPGLVLYGKILAADGETTIPATAVRLQLTDGSDTLPSSGATIATRIFVAEGDNYYVADFPFESVLEGLQDTGAPNLDGTRRTYRLHSPPAGNENAIEYDADGNGVSETERDAPEAVDSEGSGTTFDFGGFETRGAVFRMDLLTDFDVSDLPSYGSWATGIFGSTSGDGARDADPDGDGHKNEFEWIAGLDPQNTDPDSPLNRLEFEATVVASGVSITFRPKVVGRIYSVRKSRDLGFGEGFAPLPGNANPVDSLLRPGVFESEVTDLEPRETEAFYNLEIGFEP